MLTRLHIRNFKLFEEVDLDLGQRVLFVDQNNSGKTSALQALAL
ncbi:AAA family ATPase [Limisphaera sp. 4302-co]